MGPAGPEAASFFQWRIRGYEAHIAPMSRGVRQGALAIALVGCGSSGPSATESMASVRTPATEAPRRVVTRLPVTFQRPASTGAQHRFEGSIADDTVWTSAYSSVAPQNTHRRVVLRGREEVLDVDRRGSIINSRLIVDHCSAYENGRERPIAPAGSQLVVARSPRGGRVELSGGALSRVDRFWLGQLLDLSLSANQLQEAVSRRSVGERWEIDGVPLSRWFEAVGLLERLPAQYSGSRYLARVRQLDAGAAMDVETTIDAAGLVFRETPPNLRLADSSMHALFSEVLPVDPLEPALAWVMELRMGGRGTILLANGDEAPVEFSTRRVVSRTYRRLDQWLR